MTDATTLQPARNSNAVSHERDAKLLWFLSHHPATAGILAGIGLFPTRKKASKRLRRLAERRQVRLLGTIPFTGGRPEHVYGRGRWKADNLHHEVQLTRVCLKIDAEEVRRGAGQVDPDIRPDAELFIRGERYFLELDCGTMSYADVVRKRFPKYRLTDDVVLWVCPSLARHKGLRCRATVLRSTALFATFPDVLRDPHAPVWVDVDGATAALPRSIDRGEQGGAKGGDKA
jgi:hypothetical protein